MRIRNKEKEVFTMAISLWRENVKLSKNTRKSAIEICNELNSLHGTNINERSVRRHIGSESIDTLYPGRGRKTKLLPPIEMALVASLLIFVQLANSEMRQIPDRKVIIEKLKICMKNGEGGFNYTYKRFDHLYNRLMKLIADKIVVSSNNCKVEQR